MPFLQQSGNQNTFALSSVVKYEAIRILKLIFENYDKSFLTQVSLIKDQKELSAMDYALVSTNEFIKELFSQFEEKLTQQVHHDEEEKAHQDTDHKNHGKTEEDEAEEKK